MHQFNLSDGKVIRLMFRHGIHEQKIPVSNGDVEGIKTVRTPMTSCEMFLETPGEATLSEVGLTQKNPKDSNDYAFARQVATFYAVIKFSLSKKDWRLFWKQYQKSFRCNPVKFWGWFKELSKQEIVDIGG